MIESSALFLLYSAHLCWIWPIPLLHFICTTISWNRTDFIEPIGDKFPNFFFHNTIDRSYSMASLSRSTSLDLFVFLSFIPLNTNKRRRILNANAFYEFHWNSASEREIERGRVNEWMSKRKRAREKVNKKWELFSDVCTAQSSSTSKAPTT